MATASPIILILGAGPNVGHAVARAFAATGYRVALASRTGKGKAEDGAADQLHIASDLSDPQAVVGVFEKVEASLGQPPSVVVYNAYANTPNPPTDPLSISPTDFARDLAVNTTSAFVAAQQAVRGFAQLAGPSPTKVAADTITTTTTDTTAAATATASASKTFIYTGNILNTMTVAPLLDLGVGKSATAHMIQSAAAAYADRGFKFYYADERKPDGSPCYSGVDGDAHARFYVQLAGEDDAQGQGPWLQTFVKGIGYQRF